VKQTCKPDGHKKAGGEVLLYFYFSFYSRKLSHYHSENKNLISPLVYLRKLVAIMYFRCFMLAFSTSPPYKRREIFQGRNSAGKLHVQNKSNSRHSVKLKMSFTLQIKTFKSRCLHIGLSLLAWTQASWDIWDY